MSAELYSNGKGQYSLEQLPDFYALDPDEIESHVEVHTFSSQRDPTSFLKASRRPAGLTWIWWQRIRSFSRMEDLVLCLAGAMAKAGSASSITRGQGGRSLHNNVAETGRSGSENPLESEQTPQPTTWGDTQANFSRHRLKNLSSQFSTSSEDLRCDA
jgi:hypothetical protein